MEKDTYLLRLSRYVHLNPVFTAAARVRPVSERIEILRRYRWSSYRSYIGRDRPLAFVDHAPILATVSTEPTHRAQAYRRFVESGLERIDSTFLEAKNASGLCIGSESFRDRVRTWYRQRLEAAPRREDVAFRRAGTVLPAEEILATVCRRLGVPRDALRRRRRDSFDRAIASRMLCEHGGLTQRQVAEVLHSGNGACVSQHLRKLARALESDRPLQNQIRALTEELQQCRKTR